jgi:hypothetical protein
MRKYLHQQPSNGRAEMDTKYFKTEEIAERFRTSASTVRYWRMINYGPRGVRIGRQVLYPSDEVERFEAEQAVQQGGGTAA